MALQKEIILDNGIILNYHRIVSINKITNNSNIIEVASYINADKRQEEIEYYSENDNASMNVFINTVFINKEYDEDETIADTYTYLKTLEMFENSEDI